MVILWLPKSSSSHCEWYINYLYNYAPCRWYIPPTVVPHTKHTNGKHYALQDLNHINDESLFAITGDEWYTTWQIDMYIMKCLVSKGQYCSLSGGLYPLQGSTHYTWALYFNNDITLLYCSKYYSQKLKHSV